MEVKKSSVLKRVVHLPFYKTNQYQIELGKRLKDLGYETIPANYSNVLKQNYDLLHIHWLPKFSVDRTNIGRLRRLIIYLYRAKKMGIPIIWTIHNLYDHESKYRFIDKAIARLVILLSNKCHIHSYSARERFLEEYKGIDPIKIRIIKHPNYVGCYPITESRESARSRLGVPSGNLCVLFFGTIRAYKGVSDLVRSFNEAEIPKATLVIAGRPMFEADLDYIKELAKNNSNIVLNPGIISDDLLHIYYLASDIVALPYKDILTSGAALLAMSFSKACVCPKIEVFKELFDDRGVFYYNRHKRNDLKNALNKIDGSRSDLVRMGEAQRVKAEEYSWSGFSKDIADLYNDVISK